MLKKQFDQGLPSLLLWQAFSDFLFEIRKRKVFRTFTTSRQALAVQ